MDKKDVKELVDLDAELAELFVQIAEFNLDKKIFDQLMIKAKQALVAKRSGDQSFKNKTLDLRVRL